MIHYIIWILLSTLYSPVFYQLYRSRWKSIDYTHAYFILPVSLWLAWQKRNIIKEIFVNSKSHNVFSGFILLLIGLLIFIFGWKRDYLLISTFSLIPVLFGLIIYIYGTEITKELFFPILYLLLLVPPPIGIIDTITLPMRYGISVMTEIILGLFSYPIYRQGLLLSLGGHEIYMGAPCSGFRSLITIIALGLVYGYINSGSLKKKTILIASVIPLALLGNLIRVISMCLFTYYIGDNFAQKYFHDYSGIVMFLLVVLGLIGVEALLDKILKVTNE